MRVARPVISFLLVLSSCSVLNSQQSTVTTAGPQRDAAAVSLLNQVVNAMGGGAIALKSMSVVANGTLNVAPAAVSGAILWEVVGSEFRYERPGPNGKIIFVSGHGNPAIVDDGKVRRNIVHLADTNLPPHMAAAVVASRISNSAIQISAAQQVALNGSSAIKISTVDTSDELSIVISKQDWYLDPNTLLPLRVDFLASEARNALDTTKMTYLFSVSDT